MTWHQSQCCRARLAAMSSWSSSRFSSCMAREVHGWAVKASVKKERKKEGEGREEGDRVDEGVDKKWRRKGEVTDGRVVKAGIFVTWNWRSWVRILVGLSLGCIVLLFKSYLNKKSNYRTWKQTCKYHKTAVRLLIESESRGRTVSLTGSTKTIMIITEQ